jgi:hypothetical protein
VLGFPVTALVGSAMQSEFNHAANDSPRGDADLASDFVVSPCRNDSHSRELLTDKFIERSML